MNQCEQFRSYNILYCMEQSTKHNKSHIQSTKSNTSRASTCTLSDRVKEVTKRYSTTANTYCLDVINESLKERKAATNRLRNFLKDESHNQTQEHLSCYYGDGNSEGQLNRMREYYRYYTQTSILYQKDFYRMMYVYREKRKVIEYNRLKKILDLSDSQQEESQAEDRWFRGSSFKILANCSLSSRRDEESQLVMELNKKLVAELGKCRYGSVREVDQNYNFIKKRRSDVISSNIELKSYSSVQSLSRRASLAKQSLFKHRRMETWGRAEQGSVNIKKRRKHQSMDNLLTLSPKKTPYQTVFKKGQAHKAAWRVSRQTFTDKQCAVKLKTSEEHQSQVRDKIMNLKYRLQQQKEQMKRRITAKGSQKEKPMAKKMVCLTSSGQKPPSKKKIKQPH